MSDDPTPEIEPEQIPVEGKITEELSSLGKNLIGILRAAWERPERQKLQQEIEGGISDLSSTLRKEAKAVSDSPVSQRIKHDVNDLGNKVRSGQVEAKVREELVDALRALNVELEKVTGILASTGATPDAADTPSPAPEAAQPAVESVEMKAEEATPAAKPKRKAKARPKASPSDLTAIAEEEVSATPEAASDQANPEKPPVEE